MAQINDAYHDSSASHSSSDEAETDRSSMASEYHYERKVEERKDWDKFVTNVKGSGSASEQHTDFIKKASIGLKLLTILVTFAATLGGGIVAKCALFFIVAQIRPSRPITHCQYPEFEVTQDDHASVAWLWCLFFAFTAPQLFTLVRSARVYMMRKTSWPPWTYIVVVWIFETLHTFGVALLFFVALPHLDTLRAMILTHGVLFLPCLLSIFKGDSIMLFRGLDFAALLLQFGGIIIWPVLSLNWGDNVDGDFWKLDNYWALPLGLFFASFGWWESFVDETSKFNLTFLWRVKINMIEEGTRYTTYLLICIWKVALFFSLFLAFARLDLVEDVSVLFGTNFSESWRGTQHYYLSFHTELSVSSYLLPLKVLAVQVGCGYAMYIFGKFACKVNIQHAGFALPMVLIGPLSISGLIGMCQTHGNDPCAFDGSIPSHVFFQCPSNDHLASWFGSLGGWVWLLYLISSLWIGRHIWLPKSQRLASTEQMFGTPYYSGLLLEQQICMNRRSDSGKKMFRLDIANSRQHSREAAENQYEELQVVKRNKRKISSGQYHEDVATLKDDDEVTRIKGCATMWHENSEEMIEMLKSIFRMDEDYCARKMAKSFLKVDHSDNYEWEIHIFFDDAFEPDDSGEHRVVNQFVRLLVQKVDEQGKIWYGDRHMKVPDPVKYPTPYGGRLVWTLPGETKIICHLKDKDKIRHKKRWSQCMYMYYFLGYQLEANKNLTEAQKKLRARNTFLLALDGDVDFQPDAIIKLVDLMKRNPGVGASCGRIHPTGTGYMQWYQMFEYAIGHWLQKSTEHVMGCVLCSPGCFSLFRGEALMAPNVMHTYTRVSTEPRHFVQYDQGEDRWLCTLLLQEGWRVEYSAASDSFTACPEGFGEFYNQRRRWMPSTLANIMDLLGDYKRVINNNNDMSIFYIFYQVMMMIGTVLGPGSIFIMLAGSFSTAFEIGDGTSFLIHMVPLTLFVLCCLTCKTDTQILFAQLLSIVYALLMVAVMVGMGISVADDGLMAPTTLSLIFVASSFIIAGLLHPQELKCLPMGIIYFVTIPSMYLFLVIYSIFNLNVVSWGTREVPKKKTQAELEAEQAAAEAEAKAKEAKRKSSFLGSIFGKDSRMEILLGSLRKQKEGDNEIKGDLQKINAKLDQLELAIKREGYPIPQKPTAQADPVASESILKPPVTLKKKVASVRFGDAQEARDDLVNPKWINEPEVGKGEVKRLKNKEVVFWKEIIDKYLKPLEKNADQEKKVAAGLKELRNSAVFSFLMINLIWILTIFLLQNNKDTLSIRWPIPAGSPTIEWIPDADNSNSGSIHLEYEYLNMEPIGLIFVVFFAVVLIIQVVGMFAHRIMTLGHIVSSTRLRMAFNWKSKDTFDANEFIDKKGVEIFKDIIRNVQPDEKDQGLTIQEAVENSMNAIVNNDDNEIRRMSEGSAWSRGKSVLKRSETIRALKHRASEYNTRKNTLRRPAGRGGSIKNPGIDTIQEADDEQPEINHHIPLNRTNTFKDPEDLDERDV